MIPGQSGRVSRSSRRRFVISADASTADAGIVVRGVCSSDVVFWFVHLKSDNQSPARRAAGDRRRVDACGEMTTRWLLKSNHSKTPQTPRKQALCSSLNLQPARSLLNNIHCSFFLACLSPTTSLESNITLSCRRTLQRRMMFPVREALQYARDRMANFAF